MAWLLLLPAVGFAQDESGVSRAEVEELRGEVDALRAEMETLRGETDAPEGVAGWKDGRFFLQSPDGMNRLNIGGRIQPRFEYQRREADDNFSRFRFRRIRVDFRGHVTGEDLTFRIMPEFRDDVQLDTAYVNYRFSDAMQLRAGQYNVPFAWERDVSSSRHQIIERSTANNEFQWPGGGGKDIGLMLHGRPVDDIRYGIGVFGGEGRRLAGESTDGFLFSGRGTWSPVGEYPGTEVLLEPVDGTNLSFGAGAWYANKSAVRDWFPFDPFTGSEQTAHASAATVDAHLQQGRFSTHASGFFRHVDVRDTGFSSYEGSGFNVQGGYLICPERLFGSVRYSQATPDHGRDEGKTREVVAGLQIFLTGHRSKFHIEAGLLQQHDADEWRDTELVRGQYQLLF